MLPLVAISEGYSRDSRLVGVWQYFENGSLFSEITFRGDGTFEGKVMKDGTIEVRAEGKWLTRDGSLYYLYTNVTPPRIPAGTRDKDTIADITKDHIVLYSADRKMRKYVRAK
jgi:hypothetical protein